MVSAKDRFYCILNALELRDRPLDKEPQVSTEQGKIFFIIIVQVTDPIILNVPHLMITKAHTKFQVNRISIFREKA